MKPALAPGLSRIDVQRLWDEVRANLARLDACVGPHVFEPVDEPGQSTLLRKHACRLCRGTVDATARKWYERGLEHGRRK